jgi:1,4-alpha-glucan branching enzyme
MPICLTLGTRNIGHDLDFDYIRPYICGDVRVDTGLKYFRVTGPTSWKEPYDPHGAKERAAHHAGEFLQRRIIHAGYLETLMETAPIVVAPFDAELFGHWWFEGPQWLDFVIRKAAFDQNTLELTTLSGYLDRHPVHQMSVPATSTWGDKGYFEVWVNGRNDWIYPQLHECAHLLEFLTSRYGRGRRGRASRLVRRALTQCLRELLLAQSSDWPFMINNGTSAEYAVRRVKDHVSRFRYLAASIDKHAINEAYLTALEQMDNIFPKADFRLFC